MVDQLRWSNSAHFWELQWRWEGPDLHHQLTLPELVGCGSLWSKCPSFPSQHNPVIWMGHAHPTWWESWTPGQGGSNSLGTPCQWQGGLCKVNTSESRGTRHFQKSECLSLCQRETRREWGCYVWSVYTCLLACVKLHAFKINKDEECYNPFGPF